MGTENPICPNCGRRMKLIKEPPKPTEQHTFRCAACDLLFMTKDHEPVAG